MNGLEKGNQYRTIVEGEVKEDNRLHVNLKFFQGENIMTSDEICILIEWLRLFGERKYSDGTWANTP